MSLIETENLIISISKLQGIVKLVHFRTIYDFISY